MHSIRCNDKGYVGKCETTTNVRMNGHRSDAKKPDKLAVDAHFLQPGHNFERDAKFTIIEKITKKDITLTSRIERHRTADRTISYSGFLRSWLYNLTSDLLHCNCITEFPCFGKITYVLENGHKGRNASTINFVLSVANVPFTRYKHRFIL